MTGGASKIPPHIARELRRHVKPKIPNNSSTSTNKSHFKFGGFGKGDSSSSNSKLYTLLGCSAFIGITASFPFFGMAWIGRLSDKDGVSWTVWFGTLLLNTIYIILSIRYQQWSWCLHDIFTLRYMSRTIPIPNTKYHLIDNYILLSCRN